jgi:hypothetical protein
MIAVLVKIKFHATVEKINISKLNACVNVIFGCRGQIYPSWFTINTQTTK